MASEKFEKFLKLLQQQPKSDRVDIEAMRRNTDAVGGKFPDGVTSEVVSAGGVPAEMITDEGAATDRVVLYLHGGGYVAGSIDSHRNLTGNLARAMGCNVLALAPRVCLMLEGNPTTRARLEGAGATVLTYKGDEISRKGGGGPTCLTRPVLREA